MAEDFPKRGHDTIFAVFLFLVSQQNAMFLILPTTGFEPQSTQVMEAPAVPNVHVKCKNLWILTNQIDDAEISETLTNFETSCTT